jgi:GMP synthase-like glutamine amidotransferase
MRIHLIEHDPDDFSRTNITIWAEKKGHKISTTNIFDTDELPDPDDFDWLMVMGGSQHAWEEDAYPWITREKRFITKVLDKGRIILGICLGAQLLAQVLGGRIFPNDYQEIGWHEVSLTSDGGKSFLLNNIPDTFTTFHWHTDHFSLPRGCKRLAFSTATNNQVFIHNSIPVVGIQFHPEYTRELINSSALKYGHEWVEGPYVRDKEAVLSKTDEIPDTYWLMEALLNNMEREFGNIPFTD